MGKHEFVSQIDKAITAVAHQEFMTLYWPDGSVSRFHYQWLRDNCRSTERFDPVTKERKALTESIPSKLIASEIAIRALKFGSSGPTKVWIHALMHIG